LLKKTLSRISELQPFGVIAARNILLKILKSEGNLDGDGGVDSCHLVEVNELLLLILMLVLMVVRKSKENFFKSIYTEQG